VGNGSGVPRSDRNRNARLERLGLEESLPSVHDLLRGKHPHTMTTTLTYTDPLTLPGDIACRR